MSSVYNNAYYNKKLNYTEENKTNTKSRKRNILWFNLPCSKSVRSNIGKLFLSLINKHFLPSHKYRKIFNRNAIHVCLTSNQILVYVIEKYSIKQ